MPSPQLHKLIASFDQAGGDPDAGQAEAIAAYRQRMDDCAVIDARFKTLPGLIHTTEFWCHYVPEGLASLNEVGAYLNSHSQFSRYRC